MKWCAYELSVSEEDKNKFAEMLAVARFDKKIVCLSNGRAARTHVVFLNAKQFQSLHTPIFSKMHPSNLPFYDNSTYK
jgi:hypothetical protein